MISPTAIGRRIAPLLACIGLLAAWQVAALALKNDSFPTALEAMRAVPAILGDKEALINILASLRRMAIGFAAAVAVSIPLGLLMGRSRAVAAFFNPLLMVIYPVPKAALMPIIMLWLGVGDIAKTLVIFLGYVFGPALFALLLAVTGGYRVPFLVTAALSCAAALTLAPRSSLSGSR